MRWTIQEILRSSLSGFLEGRRLPVYLHRAVLALSQCRTAALGGHTKKCPEGHVEGIWYNSCRHWACPQCSMLKLEARWGSGRPTASLRPTAPAPRGPATTGPTRAHQLTRGVVRLRAS